ncbi:MAG: prephenate dehydrogenase [Candidatus Acidiferrales bacterium]
MAAPPFSRAAILGTGLIGGSFALALRQAFPETHTIGWDRPDVLAIARERGAIDEAAADISSAVSNADLVYIALPLGAAMETLPEIAAHAAAGALITDACSTKTVFCGAAEKIFQDKQARFLGGHPMAGKEVSGIEHADAELFRGARYALIGEVEDADARVKRFIVVVRRLGAEAMWCDAETHDRAIGIVSHLPQLAAVALAGVVLDETDESGMPVSLAGRGLRDALRLAGSPYGVWRDICLTNTENISRALDRLSQALDHLRSCLNSRELEEEFSRANELYKILHQLK